MGKLVHRLVSIGAAASLSVLGFAAGAPAAPSFAAGTSDLWVGLSGPSSTTLNTSPIDYNVTFGTYGPDRATDIVLTLKFSSSVTMQSSITDSICSQPDPTTVSCGPTSADVNSAGDLLVSVSPNTSGTLQATLTGAENESDPNPANNTASWSTTVNQPTTADVSVYKQGPSQAQAGQAFNYYLSYANEGPADATNVVIKDTLPAGLTFVSAEAPCTASGNVVTCDAGTVWNHSVSDTSRVTVVASAAGVYTNTATIRADQPDPVSSNNASSVTTTVTQPTSDLSVLINGSPNPVVAGQRETYTVTITNNGPANATGLNLSDSWMASAGIKGGIAFKSVTASQGSCTQSGATVSCSLGTLASGASATVTIVLQPRSKGTLSDTAAVSANEQDPDTTNNTATATTTVG